MSYADELRRRLHCSNTVLDGVKINPMNGGANEPFSQALFHNSTVRSILIPSIGTASLIVRSLDFYERPAQSCSWNAVEALLMHLQVNPIDCTTPYPVESKLFEVHGPRIGNGNNASTVSILCLSIINLSWYILSEKPWLSCGILGKYMYRTIRVVWIDLDVANAKDSLEFLNGLNSKPIMKNIYVMHGPDSEQRALWPNIVLRCLDVAAIKDVRVFERGSICDCSMAVVAKCGTTQSSKRIQFEGDSDITAAFTFILSRFQCQVVVLTRRRGGTVQPDSYFGSLECSTTSIIGRLELVGLRINKEAWSSLRSLVTLWGLRLRGCTFDGEATADFVRTIGSFVRCLYLHSDNGTFNEFGQCSLDSIYAALLAAQDTSLQLLQVFGLRSAGAGRVFRGLAASQASDIHVKKLYLDYMRPEEITTLGTLLPGFTKLQSLTVDGNTSGSASPILSAFRQNGSLCEVKMGFESTTKSSERRMLDAYGCRNQMGPKILGNLESDDSLLFLVPSLFRLAQHAPRMASTTILLGLLASKHSIPGCKTTSAAPAACFQGCWIAQGCSWGTKSNALVFEGV
jgi:hypothetical protein